MEAYMKSKRFWQKGMMTDLSTLGAEHRYV
jgi:hypothetical protein